MCLESKDVCSLFVSEYPQGRAAERLEQWAGSRVGVLGETDQIPDMHCHKCPSTGIQTTTVTWNSMTFLAFFLCKILAGFKMLFFFFFPPWSPCLNRESVNLSNMKKGFCSCQESCDNAVLTGTQLWTWNMATNKLLMWKCS